MGKLLKMPKARRHSPVADECMEAIRRWRRGEISGRELAAEARRIAKKHRISVG